MFVSLFLASAVAAWYAGRSIGILTTLIGFFSAAYVLPPVHSFEIAKASDFGALYAFAAGGIIVSLLCGAAWQLRLEARDLQITQNELVCLRAGNAELLEKVQSQQAALEASDRFFAEALTTGAFQPPANRSQHNAVRRLFEILLLRGTQANATRSIQLNAERLPDSWIFTAAFRAAQETPAVLTPLDLRACDRIVTRQGGRCWTTQNGAGSWELKFTLPRA